MMHRSTNIKFR